jgi:hypothetical protein
VRELFKVVTDFNEINVDQTKEYAFSMANTYSGDSQSGQFADEIIRLVAFAKSEDAEYRLRSLAMLLPTEKLQSTFCNVDNAIHMYISIVMSSCAGERYFSKMALIEKQIALHHI